MNTPKELRDGGRPPRRAPGVARLTGEASPSSAPLAPWGFAPRRVEKPWGHELIWAVGDAYVGKLLFVAAGQSLSLQYHERRTSRG